MQHDSSPHFLHAFDLHPSDHACCINPFSVLRSVEKYQNQFSWLRDAKFLQDLENDSVDSEIIEEELSALQEEENPTRCVSQPLTPPSTVASVSAFPRDAQWRGCAFVSVARCS